MSLKLTPTSKIQDFEFYPLIKIQNNHDLNIRSKKKIEETRVKSNDFFCSDDGNSYQEISLGEKVVQNNYDWKKQLKETFQQIEFSLYSKMKAQNKRSMNLKLYEKFLEFFCYFKPRHSISLNNISINLNLKSLTPLTPNMTHTQTAENNIVDALISRHINFLSSQSHIFQSSRNWVKSMIYIISDFLQAILSLVSCVLYILSTYIDDSTDHTFVNFIHISDYVITALFTLDLMRHFFECKHKLKFFLKGHSIIDIMAILPIYLQLIFNVQQSALGFLHILQIFRIIRILRLYRLFKEYDVEGSDKIDNSLNEARFSLQKQMAVLICTFFALLFISAGISYELNGIFDDKTYLVTRYDQGTGQIQLFYDMYTFFYAFYLMFQTFFSVGYGDVVACASSSRILICILVLLFLCIAIDQLLKLHEIKSKTSLWEYDFKKHDHTIIVGFFNENSLLRILQELFKNDCENKIKHILLVRNIPPSIEFINLMDSAIYEGRISYLQNSLLSETMPIKSNMRKCRNVFLVNECPSTFSYQQDKMLTALMHSIQECFPFITKVLRISHPEIAKSFYGNLNHWTPWNKVFSTLDLKSHLMVENIFNKGFSTIFSNLFSANRLLSMEKDLPNINWYMEYGASLLQELYCVKFSTFFLGMKFQTVMQILSKSRSRLRAEGLVLIGVKTKYSSEEYDSRTSLLINPQNYCIRLDDYGIFSLLNKLIKNNNRYSISDKPGTS